VETQLTAEEEELVLDFDFVYRYCILVESAPGTLPVAGGWEDQDNDFVEMWLIYIQEKAAAEAAKIKN
jgi:hypothetical protein